ncbi:lipase family protein [Burkholderia sp. NLJ2]|uniref:lipase family protein n=1 Tax=Burkholderia sp. NLJ2 TaxID=3090699 RepID=UPI003C6C4C13
MSIFSYSAQDAALMASLAEQAAANLDNVNPPPGWSVARTFRDGLYGAQGYIVVGNLPSNGEIVAIVAMGSTWDDYTQGVTSAGLQLVPVTFGLPASRAAAFAAHTLALHRQLHTFSKPLREWDRQDELRRVLALPQQMRASSDAFRRTLDDWQAACPVPGEAEGATRLAGQQLLDAVRDMVAATDPAHHAPALERAIARVHGTLFASVAAIDGRVQVGYLSMWNGVQDALADALIQVGRMDVFAKQFPVVFAGMTAGGPLAQLAAAYAVPRNNWGPSQQSPVTDIAVYALSSPAFSDTSFANAFNGALPTAYTVNASGVDFFPSAPTRSDTVQLAATGQTQTLPASVPTYDAPWAERTAWFYGQALGFGAYLRQPCCADCAEADTLRDYAGFAVRATPGQYAPETAAPLSILCALAYQRFQHPDTTVAPPAPWVYAADITDGDNVTWGAVFVDPAGGRMTMAFRGTVSALELVQRVADTSVYYPPWLKGAPSDAGVGQGIGTLYDALRGNFAAAIQAARAKLPNGIRQLLLCGHDAGGNLASLAMLDMTQNPLDGVPAPAQVYAFGPPPFALLTFTRFYKTTVPEKSVFLIARVADVVPQFSLNYTVYGVGDPVTLTGGDADPVNGNSYHAISSYIALLNPGIAAGPGVKATMADLSEVAGLPAAAHALFSRALEQRGITPGQVVHGVLDSASTDDGVLRIAWSSRTQLASSLPSVGLDPRRMDAYFAVEGIRVRPGHRLLMEADEGHALHLVAGSVVLEPGARVDVGARVIANIGLLQGASGGEPPSVLSIVGSPGRDGMPGGDGQPGRDGQWPGMSGSPGGCGAPGAPGGPGGDASNAELNVGVIAGRLLVVAGGGAGGQGGRGGRGSSGGNGNGNAQGGAGGMGGAGSAGGAGGKGSFVNIYFERLGPGGSVAVDAKPSQGGLGGAGGAGGAAGAGRPDGTGGPHGPSGPAGPNGPASVVTLRQRA